MSVVAALRPRRQVRLPTHRHPRFGLYFAFLGVCWPSCALSRLVTFIAQRQCRRNPVQLCWRDISVSERRRIRFLGRETDYLER